MNDHDLYAPQWVSADQEPQSLYSEILPRLFQGGTPDEDWRSPGTVEPIAINFDAVVSLFAWSQPCDWGVEELRYGFPDAHPSTADMRRVVRAAVWGHERWRSGDRVLVRCQAGLNRSGLVMALILMLHGWSAPKAIQHIRERRSPVALINDAFVDWLLEDAPAALRSAA